MSLKTLLNICKHQFHTCVFSRHLFAGVLCNRAIKTLQQTGKLCDCWALEGGRVDECRQLLNACVPHTRLIHSPREPTSLSNLKFIHILPQTACNLACDQRLCTIFVSSSHVTLNNNNNQSGVLSHKSISQRNQKCNPSRFR